MAGSDAPVLTRDSQPFVNISGAVTRAANGTPALGSVAERLTVDDAIRAYTFDGARSLGRESDFGSITVGKSADFITVGSDPFTIAAVMLAKVQVCQTWFEGRMVYTAGAVSCAAQH